MRYTAVAFLLLGSALTARSETKLDNDRVRVLDVVDHPHKKGQLHQHKVSRVMIYLDSGDIQLVSENGKVENQHWKLNQVAWSPAGARHTSENVGDRDLRIIEIELKDRLASGNPFRTSPLDPVKIDPKHFKLEFENSQVRVFRCNYSPHESGVVHEHLSDRVLVFLTDSEMRTTGTDAKVVATSHKRGDVEWGTPVKHRDDNSGNGSVELIVVELKN